MANKKNFNHHDPYPTTLDAVREQIDYWASRQNEGHPESIHEVSVKNRLNIFGSWNGGLSTNREDGATRFSSHAVR